MQLNMKEFVETVLASPRRYVMPIMTSPGMELIGAKPVDVFRDGELQFRCIDALAKATPCDAAVTFMDLSVEAEAFGSPIRYSNTKIRRSRTGSFRTGTKSTHSQFRRSERHGRRRC